MTDTEHNIPAHPDPNYVPEEDVDAQDAKAKAKAEDEKPEDLPKKSLGQAVFDEVKFFAGLFAGLLVFYTLIFGHYKIPSESMQPTLEVGDHLYVAKYAYGYSKHSIPLGLHKLPFLPDGKLFSKMPKRGDVIVFRNPRDRDGTVMIKRVVGLPGDEITMLRGRVYLNGEPIERIKVRDLVYRRDDGPRSVLDWILRRNKDHRRWGGIIGSTEYTEQWPDEDKPHRIYEITDMMDLDNTRPMIVPQGTVFMMGDNRDRSLDSRAIAGPGFVPLDHLIGRADRMMFSFKKCLKEEGLVCPKRGFMKPL